MRGVRNAIDDVHEELVVVCGSAPPAGVALDVLASCNTFVAAAGCATQLAFSC
jgi:hypothetical protein